MLTQQLRQQLPWIATRFDVLACGPEQFGVGMHRVSGIQLRLNQLGVAQRRHPLCDEALTTARASPGQELAGGGTVAPLARWLERTATLGAGFRVSFSTPLLGRDLHYLSGNAAKEPTLRAEPSVVKHFTAYGRFVGTPRRKAASDKPSDPIQERGAGWVWRKRGRALPQAGLLNITLTPRA